MAIIVNLEEAQALTGELRQQAYNVLDCTGTREIADVLLPRLNPADARTYAFERACQAPALAMMRRGVRVDVVKRNAAINELKKELKQKEKAVDTLPEVQEIWDGTMLVTGKCPKNGGKHHKWPKGEPDETRCCEHCGQARTVRQPFNPGSWQQCWRLFYDLLGLKRIKNKKGVFSVDEFVMDSLGRRYPKVKPITDAILETRRVKKQIGFLNSKLTPDGRFPSSFNVGTAWTGRWSSSKNPFGLGNNLQNIAERHRHIFIADAGCEMCYADLEQAESRTVAYVAEDEAYIDAHLTGDVHTAVCRLVWPNLPWTGDIKEDKAVASANPAWDPAPGHGYRFQAKRIQHGLNYGLTPQGVSSWAHIPLAEAKKIYERYFSQFPYVKAWQEEMARRVREQETLENPLGRRCRLFGRPWDPHTIKQALAFVPQSAVGDVLNLALWDVWWQCDPQLIQLLGQVHDAILCQYRKENAEVALQQLRDIMTIPVEIKGRTMTIPVELATGANWGKRSRKNPKGLETV